MACIKNLIAGIVWAEIAALVGLADCPATPLADQGATHFGTQVAVGTGWVGVEAGTGSETQVLFFQSDGLGGWEYSQSQMAGADQVLDGPMAFSGSRLLVGGPDSAEGTGQGRIFVLENGVWNFEANIPAVVNPEADSFWGLGVAISDDYAFLGGEDFFDYVLAFHRVGSAWTQLPNLHQSQGFGGQFGVSMSLDDQTQRLAVGFPDLGISALPGVEIYQLQNDNWISQAVVTSSDDPDFALAVAVRGDWLAVGAGDVTTHAGRGTVYMYHRDAPRTWTLAQVLVPVISDGLLSFGVSVAMPDDATVLASGVVNGQGVAYRFARNGDNAWIQQSMAVHGGDRSVVAGSETTGVVSDNGHSGVGTATFDLTCIDDCNGNGVADQQDLYAGTSQDCNGNTIPDDCDIADGTSLDVNGNGTPDECDPFCEADLNADRKIDLTDLAIFLIHYGECSGDPDYYPPADLDGRGCVGLEDLAILLADFGNVCP